MYQILKRLKYCRYIISICNETHLLLIDRIYFGNYGNEMTCYFFPILLKCKYLKMMSIGVLLYVVIVKHGQDITVNRNNISTMPFCYQEKHVWKFFSSKWKEDKKFIQLHFFSKEIEKCLNF